MIARSLTGAGAQATGWQLILADLALILFLLTLAALASEADETPSRANAPATAQIAPSQALYRPGNGAPTLSQWLEGQPHDPRATLTIFARHSGDDIGPTWEQAQALAVSAREAGYNVRIVIERGAASDLYASLAYDAQLPQKRKPL